MRTVTLMDNYEKLLIHIILSAGEKIIDAATLYRTKYSYRNSWVISVIAEEEIAKLIILPFAKYGDYLDELSDRPAIVYDHKVKQKIFTSFGIQNRSYKRIELIKQSYLYVNVSTQFPAALPVVSSAKSLNEVTHAVNLFNQIANLNFRSTDMVSSELKTLIGKYVNGIFIPAISDLLPEIELYKASSAIESLDLPEDMMAKYPMFLIMIIKYALPTEYKDFFKETKGLSQSSMLSKLEARLSAS